MGEKLEHEQTIGNRRSALADNPSELPGDFHVEGVYVEEGIRVIVIGEITLEGIPRLETVLDGLLLLNPVKLIVQFDSVTDCRVRDGLAHYQHDIEFFALDGSFESDIAAEPIANTPGLALDLA